MTVKVSVLMITYNHELYIAEAIESALNQVANFDYEIVIGEDCSTDRTREIVCEYARRHPTRIRTILHNKNLGLGGRANLVETWNACQGEYIAILEGDDFWTSPQKLQTQVDFLDNHTDYAICFHGAYVLHSDGRQTQSNHYKSKRTYEVTDLIETNFIRTPSIMLRKGFLPQIPEWYLSTLASAQALFILCALHGKIGYLPEIMAAYRHHGHGVWTSIARIEQLDRILKTYDLFRIHLPQKYLFKTLVVQCKVNYEYFRQCVKARDFMAARYKLHRAVLAYPFLKDMSLIRFLRLITVISFPQLRSSV